MSRAIAGVAVSPWGATIEMDDFVLLGLIAVVFFLLGPIGFFLTLGARSRLKNVEAQLAALLARFPIEEPRATTSARPRCRRGANNAAASGRPARGRKRRRSDGANPIGAAEGRFVAEPIIERCAG